MYELTYFYNNNSQSIFAANNLLTEYQRNLFPS